MNIVFYRRYSDSGQSEQSVEGQRRVCYEIAERNGYKIIAEYVDRATYKARLKKNGVKVLFARENITDDVSGVLMESVLEGMAEYFSAEFSQKVKRGMTLTAKKCEFTGSGVSAWI